MLAPEGRVIMVSGANRGIGRAIAEILYRAGYTLSLAARDPASLKPVAGKWAEGQVLVERYDAEDQATHRRWVDATASRFGRIDGLVNNAGMAVRVRIEEVAEPLDIEGDDLMAGLQELGNENAALVSARPGHENLHRCTAYR